MSKYCPICKRDDFEDDDKFCSRCVDDNGMPIRLITKPSSPGMGISFSGDGNAYKFGGGLNLQDSHNQTTINNYNGAPYTPQKSEAEIQQDKINKFLAACKRAYEDGVLEKDEKIWLDELQIQLGIEKEDARDILAKVKEQADSSIRIGSLPDYIRPKLKRLSNYLRDNNVSALEELSEELEPYVSQFEHDELYRKYYLILAALNPQKCIAMKESLQDDSYWRSYWSCLAYAKAKESKKAHELLPKLERFADYPKVNSSLLAAAVEIIGGHWDDANDILESVKGDYPSELQLFVDSMNLIVNPETAKEMGADPFACSFYLVNLFGQKDPKVAAAEEAERKAREEAERMAREEAERKAREEAERKAREEAEKKAREEAERKAREEAERKAREEAERKAHEEAERKAREEAERKAKEEAERKAREEAERKAKEVAARRAKEAAERKALEENAECTIYIDKIDDMIIAMMTARSALGWSSSDFRTKTSSLPAAVSTVSGKKNAAELVQVLNNGGFMTHYKSSFEPDETTDACDSDYTVCFPPRTEECSEAIDYAFGLNGKSIDFKKAVQLWKAAAAKNDPRALFDYGLCLGVGVGNVKRNIKQSVECLTKAIDKVLATATLGDRDNMLMVARCGFFGMFIQSANGLDFEDMRTFAMDFSDASAKEGNIYAKAIKFLLNTEAINILDNEYVDNILNEIKENFNLSPIYADALMLLGGMCDDELTNKQKAVVKELAQEVVKKHLYSNDILTITAAASFVEEAQVSYEDELISYYVNRI